MLRLHGLDPYTYLVDVLTVTARAQISPKRSWRLDGQTPDRAHFSEDSAFD
jgi:hypothetical protein